MSDKNIKIRDGFHGEKMIVVPDAVVAKALKHFPSMQICVTQVGYFPQAKYHYRQRLKGCRDNILFYCTKGCGYYMVGGEKFKLQANHYAIITQTTKSVRYWADNDDPWTIYWVHFTAEELMPFNNSIDILRSRQPHFIANNDEGINIWSGICDILSSGNSMDNLINTSMRLYALLATFLFPTNQLLLTQIMPAKEIADRTICYMKENIDRKIDIEELAVLNNLSRSHFSKIFRRSTGMSPIDYFIHIKMVRACHLLCSKELRINQIATMLGYDDPYYFSRLFKKSINISPDGYRASVRELSNVEK